MNGEFGQDYIRAEFQQLDDHLDDRITLYLIGGGAMAFQDLKDATKDVDVVVRNGGDLQRLRAALETIEYELVKDLDEEYERLGAQLIMENDDGCRFDIFNQQVVDKLIFSTSMQDRSQPLEALEHLSVEVAAPEDIFLFKAVAGRTGDIADMNTLVQTGLDFDEIVEEIDVQTELLDEEFFVTFVNEALGKLEERFNVTTPLEDPVGTIAERVYKQLDIMMRVDETVSIDELKEQVDLEEEAFVDHLEELEEKGNIRREGDLVQKLDNRP